jgi:hypothetical protein
VPLAGTAFSRHPRYSRKDQQWIEVLAQPGFALVPGTPRKGPLGTAPKLDIEESSSSSFSKVALQAIIRAPPAVSRKLYQKGRADAAIFLETGKTGKLSNGLWERHDQYGEECG